MNQLSRAIVLTSPRSGSEMLVNSLNIHPMIRAESEIIGNYTRRNGDQISRLPIMQFYFDEQRLLGDRRVYIFKAMYDDLDKACWKWIEDSDIKIIHLVREDFLRRAVSHDLLRRMKEIGRTSSKAFEKIDPVNTDIDIQWVVDEISRNIKAIDLHREYIKKNPHIEIKYTEMVGKEGNEITELPLSLVKKLFSFLEIDYPSLQVQLKKQNYKEVKDTVKNYEDLVKALKENNLDQYL